MEFNLEKKEIILKRKINSLDKLEVQKQFERIK